MSTTMHKLTKRCITNQSHNHMPTDSVVQREKVSKAPKEGATAEKLGWYRQLLHLDVASRIIWYRYQREGPGVTHIRYQPQNTPGKTRIFASNTSILTDLKEGQEADLKEQENLDKCCNESETVRGLSHETTPTALSIFPGRNYPLIYFNTSKNA